MAKRKPIDTMVSACVCPVCKNSTHVVVKQFKWNARVWCQQCRELNNSFEQSPEGYGSDEIDAINCWNRLVDGR